MEPEYLRRWIRIYRMARGGCGGVSQSQSSKLTYFLKYRERQSHGYKPVKFSYLLLALIFATTTASSAQSCSGTEQNADYSIENGSSNTVTLTANIHAVGDLVAFTAWCYSSCTPVSVTMGGQTAVKTSVSGIDGSGSPGTGQGFIYYILSAATSGPQTITWTVSGSHTGIQASYIDFSPSSGCTFAHDVDSPLGTGTGETVNTPSIIPTAGDLLFNFTYISEHIVSVNSPWSCPIYSGPGETQTCEFVSTVNAAAYVLSATSGSTANNMTLIHPSDTWQALITSFSMSSGSGRPAPPTVLVALPQ
jgi:hypothetical protein